MASHFFPNPIDRSSPGGRANPAALRSEIVGLTSLPTSEGVRAMVVGSGDVLSKVLSQLHRLGASCTAVDDPYRAVLEIAGRSDGNGTGFGGTHGAGYDWIVFCLPCLFPGEVDAISAVTALGNERQNGVDRLRVVLAAAEQHMPMLTASIRAGASGVLTQGRVEWLAEAERRPEPRPMAPNAGKPPTRESAPVMTSPVGSSEDAEGEAVSPVSASLHVPLPPPDPMDSDPAANCDEEYPDEQEAELVPGEPLLSADELRALLHDPIAPSTGPSGAPPGTQAGNSLRGAVPR
jgi:hypothetical protein